VAVYPGPVAVLVSVVLCVGKTVTDPMGATEPIPWSMLPLSAAVELRCSVLACPAWIDIGLAEMVTVGGGWIAVTMTVTPAVTVPPGPVAVKV
jgi:hypothetical protein